jgi:hypothetical protein
MDKVTEETPCLLLSDAICSVRIYLWLIREEPFTSLHVLLQSGEFGHARRIFASVHEFWAVGLKYINNSREVVPEFHFSADFLVHENGFDFGETRRKQKVCDVGLPPWAHRSPLEFISLMRKAMESDSICGFKRAGPTGATCTRATRTTRSGRRRRWRICSGGDRSGDDDVGQIPPQLLTKCHPSRTKSPIVPGYGCDRFRFNVADTVAEQVCLFGRTRRSVRHTSAKWGIARSARPSKTSLVLNCVTLVKSPPERTLLSLIARVAAEPLARQCIRAWTSSCSSSVRVGDLRCSPVRISGSARLEGPLALELNPAAAVRARHAAELVVVCLQSFAGADRPFALGGLAALLAGPSAAASSAALEFWESLAISNR